jgi:hypothetical protein
MMSNYKCVTSQLQYLILDTMLSDQDYQSCGINVRDLCAVLSENAHIWQEVGLKKTGKSFNKRLAWALSSLAQAEALYCKGNKQFGIGPRFYEVMKDLLSEINTKLELEIDYSHLEEVYKQQLESNPQLFIPALASGNLVVQTLTSVCNKKLHLFTDKQIMQLAEHSIVYGIAI